MKQILYKRHNTIKTSSFIAFYSIQNTLIIKQKTLNPHNSYDKFANMLKIKYLVQHKRIIHHLLIIFAREQQISRNARYRNSTGLGNSQND